MISTRCCGGPGWVVTNSLQGSRIPGAMMSRLGLWKDEWEIGGGSRDGRK